MEPEVIIIILTSLTISWWVNSVCYAILKWDMRRSAFKYCIILMHFLLRFFQNIIGLIERLNQNLFDQLNFGFTRISLCKRLSYPLNQNGFQITNFAIFKHLTAIWSNLFSNSAQITSFLVSQIIEFYKLPQSQFESLFAGKPLTPHNNAKQNTPNTNALSLIPLLINMLK